MSASTSILEPVVPAAPAAATTVPTQPLPPSGFLWFRQELCPFQEVLNVVPLTPIQHKVILNRYIPLIARIRSRAKRLTILFNTAHTIVSVGALIVPALLSIQYTGTALTDSQVTINQQIYWLTWVISLLVTISNGLITLFKLDKRFYFIQTTKEQLVSEGWQYLGLTARYSGGLTPTKPPTYDNQFIHFCHQIERIRMRQVEEEYYKLTDKHSQALNGAAPGSSGSAGAAGAGAMAATGGSLAAAAAPVNSIVQSFASSSVPTPFQGMVGVSLPQAEAALVDQELSKLSSESAIEDGRYQANQTRQRKGERQGGSSETAIASAAETGVSGSTTPTTPDAETAEGRAHGTAASVPVSIYV